MWQETKKEVEKLLGNEVQAILWNHYRNSKDENNRKYKLES